MAEEVGALRVALSANSAQFEQDMGRARDSVRKSASSMEAAMGRVSKKFGEAASMINRFGGMAAVAAAGGFAALIKKQIDAADAIGKMAQATGTSTEFLSSMGFVADQAGTSIETIGKSVQRLSKNMDDFRNGTGEAQDAFRALGLQVEDENGILRNSEDVLMDIADRFAAMSDGAEKTQLAIRLFGRAGAELIPVLNMGSDGIDNLRAKAQEMGLVISRETAMQAEYLNDELNVLKNEAIGAARAIAMDMLPALNEAWQTIKFAREESGLLTAAWVALGAAGAAAFVPSTQQRINAIRKEIEETERASARILKTGRTEGMPVQRTGGSVRVAALKAELAELEALYAEEQAADRQRMEESLARSEREAAAKREQTEAMRASLEAQDEADRLSKEEEARKKAEIKAAEDAVKAIDDQIAALELQRETFGMTTAEATLYRMSLMDGVTPAQLELAAAILKTTDAQEADSATKERALAITESVKTAAERYAETMEELGKLLQSGAIDQDTFNRAVVQAVDVFGDATKEAGDEFADLKRSIEGWGRQSADVFADMAMSGKSSFSDLIESMIRDMIKMAAYQTLFGPLFAGIGSVFSGGTFGAGAASFGKPAGRAFGGRTGAGGMYEVNERGPELLSVGNRHFLMMGSQSGSVSPNDSMGGGITFNIDARGADAQLTRALPAILEGFGQRIKSDIAEASNRRRGMR